MLRFTFLFLAFVVAWFCATVAISVNAAPQMKKFMGWYGGIASENADWCNSFNSRWESDLVASYNTYNKSFSQQLLALEDTFVQRYTAPDGKPALRLVSPWKSIIDSKRQLWTEMLNNGTMVGFFLGDELMWNGFPYEQLTEWSDYIRQQHPDAFLWENEAYPVYSGSPQYCASNHSCPQWGAPCCDMSHRPIIISNGVPPALNATSVDIYDWNPKTNGQLVNKKIRSYYETYLKTRLHPGQYLFVVPGADASNHNSECDLACYDRMCAENAEQFLEWIESDPVTIKGAMPWTWKSCGSGCIAPKDEIGCRDMNLTKRAWIRVGAKIREMDF